MYQFGGYSIIQFRTSSSRQLINPKLKQAKKSYKNSGTLQLLKFENIYFESMNLSNYRCEQEPIYTFLDYLWSGVELNFAIAIDFTGSNGHSFHFHVLTFILLRSSFFAVIFALFQRWIPKRVHAGAAKCRSSHSGLRCVRKLADSFFDY